MTTDAERPWLDDLDVAELDSAQLRALAHPTRSRIVSSLRLHGPATASLLAQRLGLNSGQTSYHVRTLADVGLVAEQADRGTDRERWWRAAQRGHSWKASDATANAEDQHAAEWLLRFHSRMYAQWVQNWLDERQDWDIEWRDAASIGDQFFLADPALAEAFASELLDLTERYRQLGNQLDPDDPAVETVTTTWALFPGDVVRP